MKRVGEEEDGLVDASWSVSAWSGSLSDEDRRIRGSSALLIVAALSCVIIKSSSSCSTMYITAGRYRSPAVSLRWMLPEICGSQAENYRQVGARSADGDGDSAPTLRRQDDLPLAARLRPNLQGMPTTAPIGRADCAGIRARTRGVSKPTVTRHMQRQDDKVTSPHSQRHMKLSGPNVVLFRSSTMRFIFL